MITPVVSMLMIKRVNGFLAFGFTVCVRFINVLFWTVDFTCARSNINQANLSRRKTIYLHYRLLRAPLSTLISILSAHTYTHKRVREHILTRAFLQRHFFIFPFSKSYKRKTMKNKEKKRVLKQPNNTNNKRQRQQP